MKRLLGTAGLLLIALLMTFLVVIFFLPYLIGTAMLLTTAMCWKEFAARVNEE